MWMLGSDGWVTKAPDTTRIIKKVADKKPGQFLYYVSLNGSQYNYIGPAYTLKEAKVLGSSPNLLLLLKMQTQCAVVRDRGSTE
jgi:hypothetical protein